MATKLFLLLSGAVAASAFSPAALSLGSPALRSSTSCRLSSSPRSLRLSSSSPRGLVALQMSDEWVEAKDPSSGAPYWYNPKTQESTWENPTATQSAAPKGAAAMGNYEDDFSVGAPQKMGSGKYNEDNFLSSNDKRKAQMEAVMERQRIQDAEKREKGEVALKSNRIIIVLGGLFIGLPVIALAAGFLTGSIPNPFEVCVQGGTNC